MWNAGLDEAQAGIMIARRNINNLRYTDDTTLMTESKEEQRSLLMKVKGEWKSWHKTQHSKNKDHGIQSHHFMANRYGNTQKLYFHGFQNHHRWWLQPWNFYKRRLLLGKKSMTNLDSILKSRDITLPTLQGPSSQGYGFSSGHVWMWELQCEESWALKYWCFWTVVLEKTLESPLDCKEIQAVRPKGNQNFTQWNLGVHWKDWC